MTYLKAPIRGDVEPGIHVLAIGVSRYFHLPGGRQSQQFPLGFSFQPLSSPDTSCQAIAEWFADEKLTHPTLPLKSVDMLASSVKLDGSRVEVPTYENVQKAISRWILLGEASPDSLLIFYFCGHGLQNGVTSHSLLCADFGVDNNDPFAQAIDYERFERGMRGCSATKQVFLLDVCRSRVPEISEAFEGSGNRVVSRQIPPDRTEVAQAVIWATASGSDAWARGRNPSVFVEAFIKAFEGGAAQKDVQSPKLFADAESVKRSMAAWITANGEVKQEPQVSQPTGHSFPLHEFGEIKIPVFVKCVPESQTMNARFSCWQDSNSLGKGKAKAQSLYRFWRIDLPEGTYTFKASLSGSISQKLGVVYPPLHPVFIDV